MGYWDVHEGRPASYERGGTLSGVGRGRFLVLLQDRRRSRLARYAGTHIT